jgi:N-acetylmuramic acid 6-phosphate etherase
VTDIQPWKFSVTLGHDIALSTISTAVIRAISLLPEHLIPPKSQVSLPFIHPLFAAAWLGGAGLDRPADLASVHARVLKLLALTDPSTLLVTNDAALLSSAIVKHDTVANGIRSNDAENKTGVVLIMGTGSIAYSFRVTLAERKLVTAPLERTSGWGYLLGDEGSAYFIGREAVRRTLRHKDLGLPPTPFHKAVARHFGCDTIGGIISSVYAPNHFREIEDAAPLDSDPKLRIATLCPIVFGAAFPELTHSTASSETPQSGNKEALDIVNLAAEAVIDIVLPLVRDKDRLSAKDATLVLGGALGQVEPYRNLIVSGLRARGEVFDNVEVVRDAAASAVRLLVRYFLLVESR